MLKSVLLWLLDKLLLWLMTAWTSPAVYTAGELMTATDLNLISDNLNALKAPPTSKYNVNEAANYTTTSTTFANVDATDLSLTIATTGGDIMVGFSGSVSNSTSDITYLDVTLDGVRQAGDDGLMACESTLIMAGSFTFLIQSVAAGSHTINLQWKAESGTSTMWAGAATATKDLHPQFWIREI